MQNFFLVIAVGSSLAGGILSALFMIYYLLAVIAGVKPEKKNIMQILGSIAFLLPQLWDDEANAARLKLLTSILVFALCFTVIYAITGMQPPR
jgi:RsiW-degrading membrane proteinase PrsW (M82 family)